MSRFLSLVMLAAASLVGGGACYAQGDSTAVKPKKPEPASGHQLRIGLDISEPVINLLQSVSKSYEATLDYYWKRELYLVLEGGFGESVYDYPDLRYRSTNSFFRVGFDKTLIKRLSGSDWDAAFAGIRYGAGFVNRQDASFAVADSIWGNASGVIPAQAVTAHWAEITGGVRVELLRNFFAGWTVRGKFLLNDRAFRDLSPVAIAGYGKGDKSTIFDFNFYLCYALRWGGERRATDKKATP